MTSMILYKDTFVTTKRKKNDTNFQIFTYNGINIFCKSKSFFSNFLYINFFLFFPF